MTTIDFPSAVEQPKLPPGRPADLPIVDGILHASLLPPGPAYELSLGLTNYLEPYVGITTTGTLPSDVLYELADTGASPASAAHAAAAFLGALPPNQRAVANLAMDSPNWRLWTNALPVWAPTGARLERLLPAQRDLALEVIEASLSAAGYSTVRNAMRLNGAVGELINGYRDTLTEFNYFFTIFGQPAPSGVWGWQLMGHHVDVHCVFVDSQLVLAPVFLGAEPNFSTTGTYAGTRAFDEETERALDLRRALEPAQEEVAVLGTSLLAADLPPDIGGPWNGRHLGGAGQDNRVIPYEGIVAAELTSAQQELLAALIDVYVDRLPAAHADLKRRQVEKHFSEMRFAWRGKHGEFDPFYYRIHSPVLLIEYDNHPGVLLDYAEPERFHIHTIVREPNGNDYGRSLLAQHYALHHS